MTVSIIMTVGIGENSTIVTGIIADGNVVCNVVMSKQQVQDHIAVLARHCALLPDPVVVQPNLSNLN